MSSTASTIYPLTFLNAVTGNSSGTPAVVEGLSHVLVQVTGINSPPAGTITFQGTTEAAGTFANGVNIGATNITTGAAAVSTTANGLYLVPVGGLRQMQCVLSGYGASGAITVTGV